MKKSLYIYLLLLVLTACAGSSADEPIPIVPPTPETPVVPADVPLAFSPYSSSVSRADGTPMQNTYTSFKVWTNKHTSSSTTETVMPGYHVEYLNDIDHWQYDGTTYTSVDVLSGQFLKYWDASARDYSFYAYAPASLSGVTVTASGFSIDDLSAHTSDQTDIIVANHTRSISGTLMDVDKLDTDFIFPQLQTFHDVVPLRFHHLLPKVTFKIYNAGSLPAELENCTVTLKSGSIYTTGDYNDGQWIFDDDDNTQSALSAVMYSTPQSLPANSTPKSAFTLTSYYELPQGLGPQVSVTMKINGISPEIPPINLPNTAWEIDKEYIYYIRIEVGDTTPILIHLTLDEFGPGDSVERTQTNW